MLKPEQLLQVEIVEAVRPLLVPGGKLLAINSELPGGSRLFRLWQMIRKAMGVETGSPDMLVVWPPSRFAFLELKRGRGEPDLFGRRKAPGYLSGDQRLFRDWAHDHGVPYAVARSVPETVDVLTRWGAIHA